MIMKLSHDCLGSCKICFYDISGFVVHLILFFEKLLTLLSILLFLSMLFFINSLFRNQNVLF